MGSALMCSYFLLSNTTKTVELVDRLGTSGSSSLSRLLSRSFIIFYSIATILQVTMMRTVCILALLAGSTNAFVAPSKLAFTATATKSQSSLHLMEPLQAMGDFLSTSSLSIADMDVPAVGEVSYSRYSYYTVLGLYIMSFPGIWSQVKRSTSAKIKRKTYVSPGEESKEEGAKDLRQQAGEIMACKLLSLGL